MVGFEKKGRRTTLSMQCTQMLGYSCTFGMRKNEGVFPSTSEGTSVRSKTCLGQNMPYTPELLKWSGLGWCWEGELQVEVTCSLCSI